MKPMLKYGGGKSKEISNFINHIPKFTGRYIEPFFGGGALFFHLEPGNAVINDINTRLMDFYTAVQQNYPQLKDELFHLEELYTANRTAFEALRKQHPSEKRVEDANETLYYNLRSMYNRKIKSEYSEAALYYFINKTAYSGMIRYNSKGEYNVPYGRYKNFNAQIVTKDHSVLLQRAEIYNVDYKLIFKKSESDDFMFLDPPYDCVFSDYGNEEYKINGFTEENHRELAFDYRNLNCRALMVINSTALTRELYHKYIVAEYDKKYSINIKNRFQAKAKHLVIKNY